MIKHFSPQFRIAFSLIVMVPSLLTALSIFCIKFEKEYVDWLNGEMFKWLDFMDCLMFLCIAVFVAGSILLLITLYTLDKSKEVK